MQRHGQPRYSAFQVISFLCHFKSCASLAGTIVHLPMKGTLLFRQVRPVMHSQHYVKLMSIHTVSESSLNINIKVVVNVCVSVINANVYLCCLAVFHNLSHVTHVSITDGHVNPVLFGCSVTLCCHKVTNFQTLSI